MRNIIFILGMHRSGTSAVSGALRFCGFGHGGALMPNQRDNVNGFWESLPIVRLNTRLLAMAGMRWDKIRLPARLPDPCSAVTRRLVQRG